MTTEEDAKPTKPAFDSFEYCIDFWQDALDAGDEIDHFIRAAKPQPGRAAE